MADILVSTNSCTIRCQEHLDDEFENDNMFDCVSCNTLREKAGKYQTHHHTATCVKKGKVINIKKNEGFGRFDGYGAGEELNNLTVCRFTFPRYPLDKTKLISGVSKDTDEEIIKTRKQTLRKIVTYLIRQSLDAEKFNSLQKLTFIEFLFEIGMFDTIKNVNEFTSKEKEAAKQKYLNALSVSFSGKARVFSKRRVQDIFVNGYNNKLMQIFQANHDL